jgi:hypothetical protein
VRIPVRCSFMVNDASVLYGFHRTKGVKVVREIADWEYGICDYLVKNLYGYRLVFGTHLYRRAEDQD